MNTKGKIVVALAVMMVAAATTVPMVMGAVEYTATVTESYNVVVAVGTGGTGFGPVSAGSSFTDNELVQSLILTNTGNIGATVSAAFTSNATAGGLNDYGLVGDTDTSEAKVLIDGTNFKLGANSYETALTNDGSEQALGSNNNVPASGSVDYDAQLNVPTGQKADVYSGEITLTFGSA